MIEENHEKTSVKFVGTGISTKDLLNASLMRYHLARFVMVFLIGIAFILYPLYLCYIFIKSNFTPMGVLVIPNIRFRLFQPP